MTLEIDKGVPLTNLVWVWSGSLYSGPPSNAKLGARNILRNSVIVPHIVPLVEPCSDEVASTLMTYKLRLKQRDAHVYCRFGDT